MRLDTGDHMTGRRLVRLGSCRIVKQSRESCRATKPRNDGRHRIGVDTVALLPEVV